MWRDISSHSSIFVNHFNYYLKETINLAKDVLCEVNNCTFWGRGNKCNASQIYVVSHKGEPAANSKETDCKTFEPSI